LTDIENPDDEFLAGGRGSLGQGRGGQQQKAED
jgi:hypothetical protein